MRIFLLMDPPTVTAQMSKVAITKRKPVFYKPENVKKAKEILIKHLSPFAPDSPFDGPLGLCVIWLFPKGKKHKHKEWRVTRPDTDNLEKLLKDCMTELHFWNDDAQVVKEYVKKIWSDEPTGICIAIDVLEKFCKDEELVGGS